MLDLVVCVGENCHLNGAEIVLKSFQSIIERDSLQDRVILKGSFCIGKCEDDSKVGVRLGDHFFEISSGDAGQVFTSDILPIIRAAACSGSAN